MQTLSANIENIAGIVRAARNLSAEGKSPSTSLEQRRQRLADFLKHLGDVFAAPRTHPASPHPAPDGKIDPRVATLTPRVQQTLIRMLAGDSEKEVAHHLGVSRHTVHVYVKALYRHFDVSSRGELLAHFVSLSPV
jgi:DNA-binding NarL/FixJ family response regulator